MAAQRRKNLIASRRRRQDDGEEEGSQVGEAVDESMSEGSGISNPDEDADGEGSEVSNETEAKSEELLRSSKQTNGQNGQATDSQQATEPTVKANNQAAITDTEQMMRGLQINETTEGTSEVQFEDMKDDAGAAPNPAEQNVAVPNGKTYESVADRRRREHEEYRKKRDSNPAFVPNRGGFFMHDHRSAGLGVNGFRPFNKGRGRGRGVIPDYMPGGYVYSALQAKNKTHS